jgi:hypothetical protein
MWPASLRSFQPKQQRPPDCMWSEAIYLFRANAIQVVRSKSEAQDRLLPYSMLYISCTSQYAFLPFFAVKKQESESATCKSRYTCLRKCT